MFTGLVREFGKVKSLQDATLTLLAKHKPQIGDSIAVNGVCLTTIQILDKGFMLELSFANCSIKGAICSFVIRIAI